jgi:hypothetical protein
VLIPKPKPPQPPTPPDAPGVEAMTTDTQQKRGRTAKIGEEAIKARRRINTKTPPPPTPNVPKAKAPPKIMETETQQKRFAKDEATGSGPTKKATTAHEEVFDLPKKTRITTPKPMKAAKPKPAPKAAPAAAEVATTPSPPKPPAPAPKVKKNIKEAKLDPASATVNVVIRELIKAKTNNQLTDAQIKEFEALVAKLKTKGGTAEVKKNMQAELRTMYRTEVFSKS